MCARGDFLEQGRLDVLVNSVWGGNEIPMTAGDGFWEQPIDHWKGMFEAGVRAYITASRCAAPLMIPAKKGLIVNVTFWDRGNYTGHFFYDLAKATMNRMAFGMAQDLRKHGVAAIALSPGFMKTELVMAAHDVADLDGAESTEYVGRAVVHLAGDGDVMKKSGVILTVGSLAREYGFTDIDGKQPPPFTISGDGHQD